MDRRTWHGGLPREVEIVPVVPTHRDVGRVPGTRLEGVQTGVILAP
jgi:hypothetical protein